MNAFDIAALSMDHDMRRVANIGQNLANVATPGYKRALESQRPFAAAMLEASADAGVDTALDVRPGALQSSSNPLDLAIQGDGFFQFDTPDGPALSRQASLHVDGQGRLVNDAGHSVLSDRGDLRVTMPATDLHVDTQGEVWAGDRSLGRLQLARVGSPSTLKPLGAGLYLPGADDGVQSVDDPHVLPGHREGSNVSSSAEMVRLMETVRHFESMSRMVQGYDEAMNQAIRKLGDLGA